MTWQDYLPRDVADLYEVRDFHHATAILANEFPSEFKDICTALRQFRLTTQDIINPGGNESQIPKIISDILKPLGWNPQQLTAETVINDKPDPTKSRTHELDYVKGRVAFDLEWNSKDQTFDRDLFAFRSFFEFDRISVGVLMTRSNDLDDVFSKLGTFTDKDGHVRPVKAKYGASTTHVGKLWWRLEQGRHGGCPVVVFGITSKLISDWGSHPKNVEPGGGSPKKTRR